MICQISLERVGTALNWDAPCQKKLTKAKKQLAFGVTPTKIRSKYQSTTYKLMIQFCTELLLQLEQGSKSKSSICTSKACQRYNIKTHKKKCISAAPFSIFYSFCSCRPALTILTVKVSPPQMISRVFPVVWNTMVS